MAWRVVDVEAQRLRFIEAAVCGERSFSSLCVEFGISRPTGYLWLKRYRTHGSAGMQEASRRPLRIPRRSSTELEEQIVAMRGLHPDWGARKLRILLSRAGVDGAPGGGAFEDWRRSSFGLILVAASVKEAELVRSAYD